MFKTHENVWTHVHDLLSTPQTFLKPDTMYIHSKASTYLCHDLINTVFFLTLGQLAVFKTKMPSVRHLLFPQFSSKFFIRLEYFFISIRAVSNLIPITDITLRCRIWLKGSSVTLLSVITKAPLNWSLLGEHHDRWSVIQNAL